MKEKIIIATIAIISTITLAIASPTFKNCGKTTIDQFGGNDGMRIAFDPNFNITNCEMDYDDSQQNGWWTQVYANLPQKLGFIQSPDGSHVNFYPKYPTTSLASLNAYVVSTTSTTQGR